MLRVSSCEIYLNNAQNQPSSDYTVVKQFPVPASFLHVFLFYKNIAEELLRNTIFFGQSTYLEICYF